MEPHIKDELVTALLAVLNSELVSNDEHNWMTCEQTSCILAREALRRAGVPIGEEE